MASEPVRVRPAAREDAQAIRDLLEELNELQRDWRVFPPRPGFLDELLDRYRKQVLSGEAVHLVAEEAGRVLGTAFAREHVVSRFSDERALEISSVIVRAEARGRGIARGLVRALAGEARRRDVEHLNLATFVQNAEAMRFWEAVGFRSRYVQMVAPAAEVLEVLAAPQAPPAPGPASALG